MIALTPDQHDDLKRIASAGSAGVPLSELRVSTAIVLSLEELVDISRPPEQRVTITSKGAAHSRRGAFA